MKKTQEDSMKDHIKVMEYLLSLEEDTIIHNRKIRDDLQLSFRIVNECHYRYTPTKIYIKTISHRGNKSNIKHNKIDKSTKERINQALSEVKKYLNID